MSKVPPPRFSDPNNVQGDAGQYLRGFHREITEHLRKVGNQINSLSESKLAATYNAITAAPTGLIMAKGDIVPKIDRAEEGTSGAKYVITGWMATVEGTSSAGSVVELRYLTGN